MRRSALQKLVWSLIGPVILFLGSSVSAWSAPRYHSLATDIGTKIATEVQEFDFDSYDELVDWLEKVIGDNEEFVNILDQIDQDLHIQACVSPSATPSSISVTSPFRFKVFQLGFTVQIGDCGMIICSTLGYFLNWEVAPQGGAILFGPSPRKSKGQVCQGNSANTKAFLILLRGVPNGNYQIKFTVGGFGGQTNIFVPVNISR